MTPETFLQIGLIGALLSSIVHVVKSRFGTEGNTTKIITIVLAVLLGVGYYLASSTPWWQSIIQILGISSIIYAFLLKAD